ncbi:MAG TPA: M14 family metallopeptidase [Caulobacteraceae bacterium]
MNSADSFSRDYQDARAKFRAAAKEAGAALESRAHPEPGPDGGDLSTDVALIGDKAATRFLVMIAGTHGAEGFCGSGAMVDWLRRREGAHLPAGVAVVMIHAINPYGFAWLRRVTEDNVDLNRNWVDFALPPPANPGYDALASFAVPAAWDEASQRESARALGAFSGEHGAMAMQQALSGGQYAHPAGIFYGGKAATWSRRTQTTIFADYLGHAERVGIIDYHTGLGPWGYGEQIVTDKAGSPGYARAKAWYGAAITSPSSGSSTSADIKGDGLAAAPGLIPHAEVTGMALEVGTQSLAEVLTAVRADAWLHAHGDLASAEAKAIKAQVRDAFFGDADDWKGMVAGQSLLATRQALAGLTS